MLDSFTTDGFMATTINYPIGSGEQRYRMDTLLTWTTTPAGCIASLSDFQYIIYETSSAMGRNTMIWGVTVDNTVAPPELVINSSETTA